MRKAFDICLTATVVALLFVLGVWTPLAGLLLSWSLGAFGDTRRPDVELPISVEPRSLDQEIRRRSPQWTEGKLLVTVSSLEWEITEENAILHGAVTFRNMTHHKLWYLKHELQEPIPFFIESLSGSQPVRSLGFTGTVFPAPQKPSPIEDLTHLEPNQELSLNAQWRFRIRKQKDGTLEIADEEFGMVPGSSVDFRISGTSEITNVFIAMKEDGMYLDMWQFAAQKDSAFLTEIISEPQILDVPEL
ncbi:MAG: hypothetical protein KDA91_23815 [Planctomycetaceae bacterium]|nr:hypothetical protein [Planctomycetaceae bacterium]